MGVQNFLNFLDSRFHGNDRKGRFRTFYETINLGLSVIGFINRAIFLKKGYTRAIAKSHLIAANSSSEK